MFIDEVGVEDAGARVEAGRGGDDDVLSLLVLEDEAQQPHYNYLFTPCSTYNNPVRLDEDGWHNNEGIYDLNDDGDQFFLARMVRSLMISGSISSLFTTRSIEVELLENLIIEGFE